MSHTTVEMFRSKILKNKLKTDTLKTDYNLKSPKKHGNSNKTTHSYGGYQQHFLEYTDMATLTGQSQNNLESSTTEA